MREDRIDGVIDDPTRPGHNPGIVSLRLTTVLGAEGQYDVEAVIDFEEAISLLDGEVVSEVAFCGPNQRPPHCVVGGGPERFLVVATLDGERWFTLRSSGPAQDGESASSLEDSARTLPRGMWSVSSLRVRR